MPVRPARRPSSRGRSRSREASRRSTARIRLTVPLVLLAAMLMLQSPVWAYKVCTDPNAPCFHESMAEDAAGVYADLYGGGGGIGSHIPQLRAGAGGEDNVDHVF